MIKENRGNRIGASPGIGFAAYGYSKRSARSPSTVFPVIFESPPPGNGFPRNRGDSLLPVSRDGNAPPPRACCASAMRAAKAPHANKRSKEERYEREGHAGRAARRPVAEELLQGERPAERDRAGRVGARRMRTERRRFRFHGRRDGGLRPGRGGPHRAGRPAGGVERRGRHRGGGHGRRRLGRDAARARQGRHRHHDREGPDPRRRDEVRRRVRVAAGRLHDPRRDGIRVASVPLQQEGAGQPPARAVPILQRRPPGRHHRRLLGHLPRLGGARARGADGGRGRRQRLLPQNAGRGQGDVVHGP